MLYVRDYVCPLDYLLSCLLPFSFELDDILAQGLTTALVCYVIPRTGACKSESPCTHLVGTHLALRLSIQSGRVGHRSREGSPAHTAGGQSSFSVTVSAANTTAVRLVAPFDDYVPLDPESNPRTMDSFTVRSNASGVFSGLWFTFLAVVGSEDEPIATKLVR